MTLSRLVPRTTTTSAKSHLLPSNIHSWLHGLPVDEGQRGGGHLAPQALNGSVPSTAFHPLLCVQTYCVPGIQMEGPYNTLRSPSVREQLDQGETALETVWEKRFLCPVTVAKSLENRPSLLTGLRSSQTCFVTYGHTCKRKGQRIGYNVMQQAHHLSPKTLCGLEHSHSTISAPRCSRTGRLQDWKSCSCSAAMAEQSRATSMLSWKAGEKGNPFILPVTAPTILCCLIEDKPNFDSRDSTRIWPAIVQKSVSVRYGACLCWPKFMAVDQDFHGFFISVDFLRSVEWELIKRCVSLFMGFFLHISNPSAVYFTLVDLDSFIPCIICVVLSSAILYPQSCQKMHVNP